MSHRHPRIHGLTAKQWVIVRLVAEGMTNAEIAPLIGNTFDVTRNCVREVYDVLGVWGRVELALWYAARRRPTTSCICVNLKPRELQVVRLLMWGYGTSEIAKAIKSKPRTVKAYFNRLYHHFGITSGIKRVKLIVLLYPLFQKESYETLLRPDTCSVPVPIVAGSPALSHPARMHVSDAGSAI